MCRIRELNVAVWSSPSQIIRATGVPLLMIVSAVSLSGSGGTAGVTLQKGVTVLFVSPYLAVV